MDLRLVVVAIVSAVILLVVSGVAGWLVLFFSVNPLTLVALMVLVAGVLAWRSDHTNIALSSVGLVMILVAGDFYLPPISALCTRPNFEGNIILSQFPESSFADDSFVCFLWTNATGFNPAIVNVALPSPINAFVLVAPFFVLLFVVFLFLSLRFNPRFWFGVSATILYAGMYVALFPNLLVSQITVTVAGVFAYGVVAPILFVVGNYIIPLSDR
jgi:hypothetical protein